VCIKFFNFHFWLEHFIKTTLNHSNCISQNKFCWYLPNVLYILQWRLLHTNVLKSHLVLTLVEECLDDALVLPRFQIIHWDEWVQQHVYRFLHKQTTNSYSLLERIDTLPTWSLIIIQLMYPASLWPSLTPYHPFVILTNSMDQSPSWEDNKCSASQESMPFMEP
jgi:hypothetical protein